MKRTEGRPADKIRPLSFTRGFTPHCPGSVLVDSGRTKVLCTVTFTEQLPQWMSRGQGAWLTAEYAMLPGSTEQRKSRDGRTMRVDGRAQEIQRLIGRALRAVLDLSIMPEGTIWVDCDVLSADGGTRTAAINGACVALYDALLYLEEKKLVRKWPMRGLVSAMSVGLSAGRAFVDLDYAEDASADVDLTMVCLQDGRIVEIQGSAERAAFDEAQLQGMMASARAACSEITELQRRALKIDGR